MRCRVLTCAQTLEDHTLDLEDKDQVGFDATELEQLKLLEGYDASLSGSDDEDVSIQLDFESMVREFTFPRCFGRSAV